MKPTTRYTTAPHRALALAVATAAALAATAPPAHAAIDRCARSAALVPGAFGEPYYRSVAPSEHFDSARNLTFPSACTPAEIAGPGPLALAVRTSPTTFQSPYMTLTRERDELFVYGTGETQLQNDGYLAGVDPVTLRQRWRTTLPATGIKGAPGVALVHGNGSIYLVEGATLLRIDPENGKILKRLLLPQNPAGSGAVYNGIVVAADGTLVMKSTERGPLPCPTASNFVCAMFTNVPSHVVTVDPSTLQITSEYDTKTPVIGRSTIVRFGGKEYFLMAGLNELERLEIVGGKLREDPTWRPVYRTGTEQAAPAPGLLRGFAVVQTDRLTAISMADPAKRFSLRPFSTPGVDQIASLPTDATGFGRVGLALNKPAFDQATGIIYAGDTAAGQQAAVAFDPATGLKLLWRHPVRSLGYAQLVGPPERRIDVTPTFDNGTGEQLLFLDAATGEELLRSRRLGTFSAGGPVTPGFDGRFYDLVGSALTETTVVRAGQAAPPYATEGTAVAGPLGLPRPKRCVSRRNFTIRLRQPDGRRLASARVLVNGRPVKVLRGRRLTARIDLRGLPKGTVTVRVIARTTGGRTVSETRRYRTCGSGAPR